MDITQCVRATHNFHKQNKQVARPWYDCVAVEAEGQHEYAQLRALFHWGDQQLALVRWYKRARMPQPCVMSKAGCVLLQYERVKDTRVVRYEVIHLSSILRREYICPAFEYENCRFWVSVFKWDRSYPDYRSLQQVMLDYNPTVYDEVVADVPADMEDHPPCPHDGEAADMDHEG